jgi:hypothetical protein
VDADADFPAIALGEAPIRRASAHVAVKLPLRQVWTQQRIVLNDIINVIGLAPGENVSFGIKRTQRNQVSRKTVQEKTETFSAESTIVDKDVVAVTRTTVGTQKWTVTGTGEISLGGLEFLGNPDIEITPTSESSFQDTLQTVSQMVREATRKSSEQLTLIQKIEITETQETTIEEQEHHKIVNPYLDRALQIHFFDLRKEYSVNNIFDVAVDDIQIVLALDFRRLHFGPSFVRRNTAFLEAHFEEHHVLDEYFQLLQDPEVSADQEYGDDAQRAAEIALDFLFRVENVFGLEEGDPVSHQIWNSFVSGSGEAWEQSALHDALQENALLARLYTGIAYFYRIYMQLLNGEHSLVISYPAFDQTFEQSESPGLSEHSVRFNSVSEIAQFKVDLAVALADFIAQHFDAADEEQLRVVMDQNNRTEVFRRLAGFAAMVHGIVAEQRQEDDLTPKRRRRAVLEARIAEHLKSYDGFYRQRYVEFIATNMHAVEFLDTYEQLQPFYENQGLPPLGDLKNFFAFESGYVDGARFIIPSYFSGTPQEAAQELGHLFDEPAENFEFDNMRPFSSTQQVSLPIDGVHVEAVPGFCSLPDLPATLLPNAPGRPQTDQAEGEA